MAALGGPPGDGLPPPSRTAFGIFLAGQATSLIGDGLAILAIPLLVLEVTRSPLAAALSAAPRTIGYLLVGVPAGALVDRMNPRNVMLTMDLVRMTVFLVLAALIAAGTLRVWIILTLAFTAAGAGAFFETALAVAVHDLVVTDRLVRANSYLEGANQAGLIVGPGLVGVLAATVGINISLLVNAGTFAVSFGTVFCVVGGRRGAVSTDPLSSAIRNIGHDLVAGARFLRSMRVVFLVTCLQAAVSLFLAADTLIVFYAKDTLRFSAPAVSAVVGAGGVGGIVGAVVAVKLGRPAWQVRFITLGAGCLGIALFAIGLAGSLPALVALNLMMGASTVLATVIIRALRQRLVPRELLGRITATARAAALAASPIGTMIAGILAGVNHGNPRPVFLGAGALAVGTTAIAWFTGLRKHSGVTESDDVANLSATV